MATGNHVKQQRVSKDLYIAQQKREQADNDGAIELLHKDLTTEQSTDNVHIISV